MGIVGAGPGQAPAAVGHADASLVRPSLLLIVVVSVNVHIQRQIASNFWPHVSFDCRLAVRLASWQQRWLPGPASGDNPPRNLRFLPLLNALPSYTAQISLHPPQAGQLAAMLSSMAAQGGAAPPPAAAAAVQRPPQDAAQSLAAALAAGLAAAQHAQQRHVAPGPGLAEVLKPEVLAPLLREPDVLDRCEQPNSLFFVSKKLRIKL